MFHYDAGLFLTLAQWRSTCAVASRGALCRTRTPITSRGTSWRSRRRPRRCLYRHRLGPAPSRARNGVSRADGVRRPAADRAIRPAIVSARRCCWPTTASDRCSTRATSSWMRRQPPSRPSCRTPTFSIMESTFGRPHYRLPPRDDVIAQLAGDRARRAGRRQNAGRFTPIRSANRRKSRSCSRRTACPCCSIRSSTRSAASTKSAASIWATSACSTASRSTATRSSRCRAARTRFRLPVWAERFRSPSPAGRWTRAPSIGWGVDHALPLSDHADYDQLIETVRRVEPREVYLHARPGRIRRPSSRPGLQRLPAPPAARNGGCFETCDHVHRTLRLASRWRYGRQDFPAVTILPRARSACAGCAGWHWPSATGRAILLVVGLAEGRILILRIVRKATAMTVRPGHGGSLGPHGASRVAGLRRPAHLQVARYRLSN